MGEYGRMHRPPIFAIQDNDFEIFGSGKEVATTGTAAF
jgi:hypothetical protein